MLKVRGLGKNKKVTMQITLDYESEILRTFYKITVVKAFFLKIGIKCALFV
jgi:hypothetical protein